jgi:hypothetical protein
MTREDRGASSFDELAVGLSSGTLSRGKALKLMGAALVGGALGSLGIREASADLCKPEGKACKKNSQCCSGFCFNNTCRTQQIACRCFVLGVEIAMPLTCGNCSSQDQILQACVAQCAEVDAPTTGGECRLGSACPG